MDSADALVGTEDEANIKWYLRFKKPIEFQWQSAASPDEGTAAQCKTNNIFLLVGKNINNGAANDKLQLMARCRFG